MKRMALFGGAALLLSLFSGCAGTYVGVGDYGYYDEPAYYPYYGTYYVDGGHYHGRGHGGGSHGHH